MKRKMINKKLNLNKSTISDLGDKGLSRILGGGTLYQSCVLVCYPTTLDECPETQARRCDTYGQLCATEL